MTRARDVANIDGILTTKGDIYAATAASTPARLGVGSNGDTIVADSSTSTGLRYQPLFGANKNKIINGDFYINQRNFSSTTTQNTYGFDRWSFYWEGGTVTYSAQNFTPGTAPVAGYEGKSFMRLATTGQSASGNSTRAYQKIEDVRTFAGQTVTVSFWAKASSGTPFVGVNFIQDFGTGGSPSGAAEGLGAAVTISTSWARYSVTRTVASISGKTIGTTTPGSLNLGLWTSAGSAFAAALPGFSALQNVDIDIWGVQVEAGSVATAFQTATGTIQGELAACQRYYFRYTNIGAFEDFGYGNGRSTVSADCIVKTPVTMRVRPTSMDYSNLRVVANFASSAITVTSASLAAGRSSSNCPIVYVEVASGLTTSQGYYLLSADSTSYIGFDSEL
jgi:hypothetical protein